MNRLEGVAIAGLAGWRLASLLVNEDGPGAVFARLRRAVGVPEQGEATGLAAMLSCVWCTSVWTVAGAWAVWRVAPDVSGIVAAMAVAVATERWVNADG